MISIRLVFEKFLKDFSNYRHSLIKNNKHFFKKLIFKIKSNFKFNSLWFLMFFKGMLSSFKEFRINTIKLTDSIFKLL